MSALFFTLIASLSTFAGGIVAIKNQNKLNKYLAYTAGVLLGVVAFDLLPEIFDIISSTHIDPQWPMIALVCGFLLFHIVEKSILIHHSHESDYETHRHPHVGIASALALIGHSFLDGVGIGIGFQASNTIGIAVAIAVIAHDFTDGLNTVNLLLLNNNRSKRAIGFLLLDAVAPILGALSTIVFTISDKALVLYLGFFAGFLLYIGASEILPEAHRKNSSYLTIGLTIFGAAFMYLVTQII
jgi:ZIP family zinc transporter